MLEHLDDYDGTAAARQRLQGALEARVARGIVHGGGDGDQVARAEAEVAADPRRAIRFDDGGDATVIAAGRRYRGGRFETPSLGALRARALAARAHAGRPDARLSLFVLDGKSPLTDIGALQAEAPPRSLFQVASQFNCLESPGAFVTRVAEYFHDPTQGPRASISAFPGTLVRHYAAPAPGGGRFVQASDGAQLDLLADVCDPGVAAVASGYLRGGAISDAPAFARALEDRFDAIQLGLHAGIEVVLGADWTGAVEHAPFRTIAQAFTSTVAGGMYGGLDDGNPSFAVIVRQLQRAAYLGTILGAAALGADRVVLTLIGGGVFANPIEAIWDAIVWAADQARHALHRDLIVVVNGRELGRQVAPDQLRQAAAARGGALVRLERDGVSVS
jgi:hypothetical protein